MTSIATGYYINRAFGITLTLIFLTFSGIQIYLLRQNTKKLSDVKYLIHYCVFGSCATLLLSFIDSYGVFGLLPEIFSLMTVDVIGMKILMSSALFIIYGHFTAHYRVLKREVPKFFKVYLTGIFILNCIGSLVFQPLIYFTSNPIYSKLSGANGLLWLYGTWIIDMYGYYLVRKSVLEVKAYSITAPVTEIPQEEVSRTTRSASPSQRPDSPNTCSNQFDYDAFLSRMRNFHCLFTVTTFFFSALNLFSLIRGTIRQSLNPNKFSFFDGLIFYPYLYFLVGCFLLWWVWLPIKFQENCKVDLASRSGSHQNEHSHRSTEVRSGYKASKRENRHPYEEEEMVILNQSRNNLPESSHNNLPESSHNNLPESSHNNLPESSKGLLPSKEIATNTSSPDETSLLRESTREISISVSELNSPKKDNHVASIAMAGITEEGGIVTCDEK